MKKLLVSIYDTKAKTWSNPVVADTEESAIRDFDLLVRDKRTMIGQHPEDFQLVEVGFWSPDYGAVNDDPAHRYIVAGGDLVNGVPLPNGDEQKES